MENQKPQASISNHAKAPKCAAFVAEMRKVFGDIKVLYVREGKFTLGEPQ